MTENTIQEKIASFTCIEEALNYFEIEFDSRFIENNRTELVKRFNGYLILTKPDDWFSGRRALKNAYCKVQRSLPSKTTRSACRGCTSCQRR
ncbi:TPA: nitrogen fixation protein NifW [Vibrio parahaemolyticus]|nr:nitrogen fixation protein NifW [Vibrio parahaemolyticus]